MKKVKIAVMVVALFCILGITGCSNREQDEEKGAADRITTEAAKKMDTWVRTPIDKAKATHSLGDERMKEMDKALKNR